LHPTGIKEGQRSRFHRAGMADADHISGALLTFAGPSGVGILGQDTIGVGALEPCGGGKFFRDIYPVPMRPKTCG
jgi:hypothetical protein